MNGETARGERLALVVAYDGTELAGWQIQPDLTTVQGTVRGCFS